MCEIQGRRAMAASIRKIGNDTEVDRILNEKFTTPVRTGYVEAGEDKVCLPIYYEKYEERFRKFQVRDDDVYLLGLAKSGTTWCHEMLWMIVNDLNFEGAKRHTILRCPLLEVSILYDFDSDAMSFLTADLPPEAKDFQAYQSQLQSPRCIKSHLNWSLLPEQIRNGTKNCKIIGLVRNPRDSCVSHYHQASYMGGYHGTFEEFCELYLHGRVPYGPYWKHTLKLWNQRHNPNVLILTFEEMKADIAAVIRKVAGFLNKTVTEEGVQKLVQHLSFESTKNNKAMNDKEAFEKLKETTQGKDGSFFRAGKVGDHKSIMTPEMNARFEKWIEENVAGTDFDLYKK